MNDYLLFGTEILIALGLGFTVQRIIKPSLGPLLLYFCKEPKASTFWGQFTRLMIYLAPLLLVAYFSQVGEANAPLGVVMIKNTLFRGIFGVFIAVIGVAYILMRITRKAIGEQDLAPDLSELVDEEHG